jgi:predicted DsbA family dithiol-disulfide isomerase
MLQIEVYTDPGCPFAWSAEPAARRIEWLYGEQLSWTHRLVVLSERPEDYLARGFDPEQQSAGLAEIRDRWGMPIDASLRPRVLGTVVACRAVVAARRHAPDRADALLRRLRIAHLVLARLIDEPEVLADAAVEAGIDVEDLFAWMREDGTESELRADARAARSPLPAAAHLDHKLAGPRAERRYTCPSWVVHRDGRPSLAAPGFQPVEVYEALIANLAPELRRREDPESALDVIRWAPFPLSTAEIAAVMGVDRAAAENEIERFADAQDGFWPLQPRIHRDSTPRGQTPLASHEPKGV